ncbi:MAG: hypothetical protein WD824_12685 [Cyclobacteriaceae bacterium]
MNTLKKSVSRLSIVLLVLTMACISDDPDMKQSVYVAGSSNGLAVYWENGVMVPLTTAEMNPSSAQSIFVSGKDVYVSGTVSSVSDHPVYWKNDVLVTLPETDQRQ